MNYTITQMLDEDGQPIENAPHPKQKVCIPIKHPLEKYSIFRRKKYKNFMSVYYLICTFPDTAAYYI